ncbi:MAG: PKD domain-containing protein [Terriglobia bacterium]|jgi:hypothetical protein
MSKKNLDLVLLKFAMAVTVIAILCASRVGAAETISSLPNPCSAADIPVWTSPGQYSCYTLAQYNAAPAGSLNVACPNGGAYNASVGIWECNNGPSPVISQQYLSCISLLGPIGVCDPIGFGTSLISNFLPGVSEASKVIAAVELVENHTASWATVCATWSLAEPDSLEDWEQLIMDATCPLLEWLGGSWTSPTIQLFAPQVSGLQVTVNGVTEPTTKGATIVSISWNFGDGSPITPHWFPVSYTYAKSGTYSVTATSTDSNGLTQSATTSVTVSAQKQTPPTIELFAPEVSGLQVTINGVTEPTTPGVTTVSITWNFGDGSPVTTSWFPASHEYPNQTSAAG